MAVISPQTAPNFVFGEYFKVLRAGIECAPGDLNPRLVIYVGFWPSDYARKNAPNAPSYTYPVTLPIGMLLDLGYQDPRDLLYEILMKTMFKGINATPDHTVVDRIAATTLYQAQSRKKAEIMAAKEKSNRSFFVYDGVKFNGDDASMLQINVTMNGILARGGLREDWNGAWLALDNTPYPVPDVETWYALYGSIEETGQRNFDHARALKYLVDQCTAMNQVAAINWDTDLSTFQLPEPLPDQTDSGSGQTTLSGETMPVGVLDYDPLAQFEQKDPPPLEYTPAEPVPDPVPEPEPETEPEPPQEERPLPNPTWGSTEPQQEPESLP